MNRKYVAIVLVLILLMNSVGGVWAELIDDRNITSDVVGNQYVGRTIGSDLIRNLNFADVANNYWANEPITRMGALNVVKGYNENNTKNYKPTKSVSKQEALAFILRVVGKEAAAQQAALAIEATLNSGDPLMTLWSKGYLNVAQQMGLITLAEYNDAIAADQTVLDPTLNFIRGSEATREQFAKWLVDAINNVKPASIVPLDSQQAIFGYSDWETIGQAYVPYVEVVSQKKIMVGSNQKFNPKKSVTRAEVAQIITNVDDILYNTMNVELRGGVVAQVNGSVTQSAIGSESSKTFLIRANDGLVDSVTYNATKRADGTVFTKDVPVYENGDTTSLNTLREGNYIEYLVDKTTKEMLYIENKGTQTPIRVTGVLQPLDNFAAGKITIRNSGGVSFTYQMADGLYNPTANTIAIENVIYPKTSAPVTNKVTLVLINNIVTNIEYDGAIPLSNEVGGIVTENNTKFGYLTLTDWDGKNITKYYNKSKVIVEKLNAYDDEGATSYIDELFPDYRFNVGTSTIENVEAGDIVHLLLDPTDTKYISKISAKTNYIVKFGTVDQIVDYGASGVKLRIGFADGTTSVYEVSDGVPVLKKSMTVGIGALQDGDLVKMLVNQAVISSGRISEVVKEIVIDPYGNTINNIYRGKLGTINNAQQTLTLRNAYTLSKAGWTGYTVAKEIDLSKSNISYYNNGQRVTLDYAMKYLNAADTEVYVAMEKYFTGEKAAKITFRNGRDSILDYSNITYANGTNQIKTLDETTPIAMDEGTIIVKNGRLVSINSVLAPDYSQVVLNGGQQAAVLNIVPEPNNDAISIFRGRVAKIVDNETLQVQSNASFKDMSWIYSPIQRVFELNYDTQVYTSEGAITLDKFITYSDITQVDEVYTIVSEGTKAKYITKLPYPTEGITGDIYSVTGKTIMVKDVLVYANATKDWQDLSLTNSYAQVDVADYPIIIKNNKIIAMSELEIGDRIKVLSTVELAGQLKLTGKRNLPGYIILVEQ